MLIGFYILSFSLLASFEVTINNVLVYSKLKAGNFPKFDKVSIFFKVSLLGGGGVDLDIS